MRTYQSVYRFRYLPEVEAWEKIILFPAIVSGTTESYDLSTGMNRSAKVTVRIVSPEKQDVCPGDVIGFVDTNSPDMDHTVTVVSVTDNRKGTRSVSHTKLVCR